MKKIAILIFSLLFTSSLFAEPINEYKSDIYFANGVGASSRKKSKEQGRTQIKKYKKANSKIYKNFIGKYDLAFNTGHGIIPDFYEAWLQYLEEHPSAQIGWNAFKEALGKKTKIGGGAVNISEAVTKKYEAQDLNKQVEQYEKSILAGHDMIKKT